MKRENEIRDKAWRIAVRETNDYKCIHCNNKDTLQACHIIGRNNKKTRWVVENGIPGCHELHRMMEKTSRSKKKIVAFYYGGERYSNLEMISKGVMKPSHFGYKEV